MLARKIFLLFKTVEGRGGGFTGSLIILCFRLTFSVSRQESMVADGDRWWPMVTEPPTDDKFLFVRNRPKKEWFFKKGRGSRNPDELQIFQKVHHFFLPLILICSSHPSRFSTPLNFTTFVFNMNSCYSLSLTRLSLFFFLSLSLTLSRSLSFSLCTLCARSLFSQKFLFNFFFFFIITRPLPFTTHFLHFSLLSILSFLLLPLSHTLSSFSLDIFIFLIFLFLSQHKTRERFSAGPLN